MICDAVFEVNENRTGNKFGEILLQLRICCVPGCVQANQRYFILKRLFFARLPFFEESQWHSIDNEEETTSKAGACNPISISSYRSCKASDGSLQNSAMFCWISLVLVFHSPRTHESAWTVPNVLKVVSLFTIGDDFMKELIPAKNIRSISDHSWFVNIKSPRTGQILWRSDLDVSSMRCCVRVSICWKKSINWNGHNNLRFTLDLKMSTSSSISLNCFEIIDSRTIFPMKPCSAEKNCKKTWKKSHTHTKKTLSAS